MNKITIISTKGGVGKTTLTANLGGILANAGYKVLMIDADPQPTLSSYYALKNKAPHGITHLMTAATVVDVISQTNIDNLDIVLSDDDNGSLREWIRDMPDGRVRLKHVLSSLDDRYDFILIDTQGAVGPMQDAAACAGDYMVSPIPPEMLAAREFMRGTIQMIERLQPMAQLNAPIGHLYGVIYKLDGTNDSKSIAAELKKASFIPSKGGISIMESTIPHAVAFRDAASHQIPVHQTEKNSKARTAMIQFASELIPNLPNLTEEI